MTRPASAPVAAVRLGTTAGRVLASEVARRPGPKTCLLVGAAPACEVLRAVLGALSPDDSLAVTAPDPAGMRDHLASLGRWVSERVRVVGSPAEVDGADVVVLAEAVGGTAERARAMIEDLAKHLRPGGVLSAATAAVPGVSVGAPAELSRLSVIYGTGSDLVLRNLPPVRVHRFAWSGIAPDTVDRLEPVARPSSVALTRDLRIDSNGVAAAGIALLVALLSGATRPRSPRWLLPAAAALPVAAFFRDPHREPPPDRTLVVAASDGRVMSVERVVDDRFTTDGSEAGYLRIAAFLSVLDVHVNRAPVAGTVADHFLADGGYAPAMLPEAEHNVSAYTVLDTPRGRVAVAQRTGLIARRIVQRAPVGSVLARGERFGLIRFGSRTDVYLPADAVEPLVAPGDRLQGGTTPVARWR